MTPYYHFVDGPIVVLVGETQTTTLASVFDRVHTAAAHNTELQVLRLGHEYERQFRQSRREREDTAEMVRLFSRAVENARSEAKIAYRESCRLNALRADALADRPQLPTPKTRRRWKRRVCGEANRYRVMA